MLAKVDGIVRSIMMSDSASRPRGSRADTSFGDPLRRIEESSTRYLLS